MPLFSMFDSPALARIVPFAIYMAFIVIADLFERLGVGAAELRWLYAVKIAAVLGALWYYRRSYQELRVQRPGPAWLMGAALAGVLVLVLWLNLDTGWMVVGGAGAGFDPRNEGRIDWLLVIIRLGGAALVVPVMEELFWRSFLMRWIAVPDFQNVEPSRVGWKAVAITVVLFGVEHNLWLAGMAAGLVYSWLYMRSGNLWTAILAHAVTNGLLGCWIIATEQWTYW